MPLTELPTKTQYDLEAFLLVGSALGIVFDVLRSKVEAEDDGITIEDLEDKEKYEQACQHLLKNALVFTHQAYEMFFRGAVCQVSPFLLIPDHKYWVESASRKKLRFSEIRSVSAIDLPSLANAVCAEKFQSVTTRNFESLRELRNRLVHATPNVSVERHQLVKQITHLTKLLGWRNTFLAHFSYLAQSHTSLLYSIYDDPLDEITKSHLLLRACRRELGELFTDQNLLGLDGLANTYCPRCYLKMSDAGYSELTQRTSIEITGNLVCGVCDEKSQVISFDGKESKVVLLSDYKVKVYVGAGGELIGNESDREPMRTLDEIVQDLEPPP